jgi:hypothetical protein
MLGVFIGVAALIAGGRSAQSLRRFSNVSHDAISAFRPETHASLSPIGVSTAI